MTRSIDQSPWGKQPRGGIARRHLKMAEAFIAAANPNAALREAEAAIACDGSDEVLSRAFWIIGKVHLVREDWPAVMDLGQRLIALDPQSTAGYVILGRGLLATKDWRRCDEIIAAGFAANPCDGGLMQLMSERSRVAKDYAIAEEWARKALSYAPDHLSLLGQLTGVLVDAGKHRDAMLVIERMVELAPNDGHGFEMAAYAAYKVDRFDEAAAFARQVLERDPASPGAHLILKRAPILGQLVLQPVWTVFRQPRWLLAAVAAPGTFALLSIPTVGAIIVLLLIGYLGAGLATIAVIERLHRPQRPKVDILLSNY